MFLIVFDPQKHFFEKKIFGQKVLGKRILQLFKLKILEKRVLWPFSRVFFKHLAHTMDNRFGGLNIHVSKPNPTLAFSEIKCISREIRFYILSGLHSLKNSFILASFLLHFSLFLRLWSSLKMKNRISREIHLP